MNDAANIPPESRIDRIVVPGDKTGEVGFATFGRSSKAPLENMEEIPRPIHASVSLPALAKELNEIKPSHPILGAIFTAILTLGGIMYPVYGRLLYDKLSGITAQKEELFHDVANRIGKDYNRGDEFQENVKGFTDDIQAQLKHKVSEYSSQITQRQKENTKTQKEYEKLKQEITKLSTDQSIPEHIRDKIFSILEEVTEIDLNADPQLAKKEFTSLKRKYNDAVEESIRTYEGDQKDLQALFPIMKPIYKERIKALENDFNKHKNDHPENKEDAKAAKKALDDLRSELNKNNIKKVMEDITACGRQIFQLQYTIGFF